MIDLIERAKEALEGATPGPWSLSQDTCYSGRMSGSYYRVWDNDLNAICAEEYGAHNDGGAANMRLIAMSPDLARALIAAGELAEAAKEVRNIANMAFGAGTEEREGGSGRRQGKLIDDYERRIDAINAALARFRAIAEGKE
jgi:hypothetical protein